MPNPSSIRRCRKCAKLLPLHAFSSYLRKRFQPKRECKKCAVRRFQTWQKRHKREWYKTWKKWAKKNTRRRWSYLLRAKYGIDADEYERLLAKCNKKCHICHQFETAKRRDGRILMLSVDHDHKTGEVRGLLCLKCNKLVAYLEHSLALK